MRKIKVMMLAVSGCLLMGCGVGTMEKGVSFLEEKNYEKALEVFEEGTKKEKNAGEAYRGMGIAYFEMEQYEEAAEAFEKALEKGGKETGTIYNLLGTSNLKLENYEEALEYYQKGIAMEDCSGRMLQEMQFNEILIYEKMGDWESAKRKVKEYIAEYPGDAKAAKEAEFLETR